MKLVRRFASVGFLTLASVVFGYFGSAARGNAAIADLDAFIAIFDGVAVFLDSNNVTFSA
jgi:hypothetical protein